MTIKLPEFDVLLDLYRQDPEGLEQLRRQLLQEAISSAPASHRESLQRLVLQMNQARESAGSPMEAAAAAFQMMQESTRCLRAGWELAATAVAELQTAIVIEKARSQANTGEGCVPPSSRGN